MSAQQGSGGGEPELEDRAEELDDLAAMQADPGEGVVGAESDPAAAPGHSAGTAPGTDSLGLGTLDQGATAQVTGTDPGGEG